MLRNASPVVHNFTLAAQSIAVDVPPNTITVVEVTIPSSGGALFYCRFHSDKGMNGQLLAGRTAPQPLPGPGPTAASPR